MKGDNSSLHGDFEDVGHVPKVVHFEPLKVAIKWSTLTGHRHEAFARRAALPSGGNAVNITKDVRKYAAEQAISEEEALQRGMAEKSTEFEEAGEEVYAKP